jgi:hypothetical protein
VRGPSLAVFQIGPNSMADPEASDFGARSKKCARTGTALN